MEEALRGRKEATKLKGCGKVVPGSSMVFPLFLVVPSHSIQPLPPCTCYSCIARPIIYIYIYVNGITRHHFFLDLLYICFQLVAAQLIIIVSA